MMYSEPIVLVQPASEPVSLAELAAHLRQDSSDDDSLLVDLITEARETVEKHTGRALISRTLQLNLSGFTSCGICLPYPPLGQIISFQYYGEDEVAVDVDSAIYQVDTVAEPGCIVLRRGYTWPSLTLRPRNGVVVEYTAGYGEADQVPATFKRAIKMLAAHWYRNRDAKEVGRGLGDLLTLENVYV